MFAESITFEDAIKITHLRGKLMQSSEEGKMMAILGLDSKIIDEVCSQINESNEKAYVASANYNSISCKEKTTLFLAAVIYKGLLPNST